MGLARIAGRVSKVELHGMLPRRRHWEDRRVYGRLLDHARTLVHGCGFCVPLRYRQNDVDRAGWDGAADNLGPDGQTFSGKSFSADGTAVCRGIVPCTACWIHASHRVLVRRVFCVFADADVRHVCIDSSVSDLSRSPELSGCWS